MPLVMNVFAPSITKCRRAPHRRGGDGLRSLPVLGSVIAMAVRAVARTQPRHPGSPLLVLSRSPARSALSDLVHALAEAREAGVQELLVDHALEAEVAPEPPCSAGTSVPSSPASPALEMIERLTRVCRRAGRVKWPAAIARPDVPATCLTAGVWPVTPS